MWKTLRGIRDGKVYIFFAKKIPIRVCSIFQIYHGADFAGFDVIKNDVVGQDDVMLDDMDCDRVKKEKPVKKRLSAKGRGKRAVHFKKKRAFAKARAD